MRYLITGGGTGGHIYPALSIAAALKELDPEAVLLYVGTETGREAAVVPAAGLPFVTIRSGGMVNLSLSQKLAGGVRALRGLFDALGHIRRFRPDLVLGTGGFVCGPVLLAARLAGRPVVIQEQNAFPGVTNRIAARWARLIFVPYEEARTHFPAGAPIRRIGNPVRPEIGAATREAGRRTFGFAADDQVLLVMGGSGGARDLNRAVAGAVLSLRAEIPRLTVLHVSGERYYEQVQMLYTGVDRVTVVPYLHTMPEAYAAADAGVFRAGALTMAEVQVRALPAVLVPSPNVTHDHQEWNARTLERRGAALVVREREVADGKLVGAIRTLLTDEGRRAAMQSALQELAQPGTAHEIARLIIDLARTGR